MEGFDLDAFPRPYLNLQTKALKALSTERWNVWRDLFYIWIELQHRRRNVAQQLMAQVSTRLFELYEQRFTFPSTQAPIGMGQLRDVDWEKESLLSLLGYSVAEGGESDRARHIRLDRIYTESVPEVVSQMFSTEYLTKWGAPKTGTRLRQMAVNIATSVQRAKRRSISPRLAIAKWEADLDYLKREYYSGLREG